MHLYESDCYKEDNILSWRVFDKYYAYQSPTSTESNSQCLVSQHDYATYSACSILIGYGRRIQIRFWKLTIQGIDFGNTGKNGRALTLKKTYTQLTSTKAFPDIYPAQ